jgi:hypothetical protein
VNSPFVPKGIPRPLGPQTCGYMPTGSPEHYCGKPATWHVMWDSGLDNSLTCDEHMALTEQRWVFDDRHPVVADCTMPGALWLYAGKRCEVPASDGKQITAAAMAVTR